MDQAARATRGLNFARAPPPMLGSKVHNTWLGWLGPSPQRVVECLFACWGYRWCVWVVCGQGKGGAGTASGVEVCRKRREEERGILETKKKGIERPHPPQSSLRNGTPSDGDRAPSPSSSSSSSSSPLPLLPRPTISNP